MSVALFGAFDMSAYDASYYAGSSVLSSGRWVKIKVSETGMQQLTREQLAAMGFDDMSRVTVYGYGGALLAGHEFLSSLPDDLPQQPVMYCDDKIVFYGEADVVAGYDQAGGVKITRNNASCAGYYFLTDSRQVAELPSADFYNDSIVAPRLTHVSLFFHEEEKTNPSRAGAHYFGKDFADAPVQYVDMYLPDIVSPSTQEAHFAFNGVLAGTSPSFELTYPNGTVRKVTGLTTTGISLAYFYNVSTTAALVVGAQSDDDMYRLKVSSAKSKKLTYGAIDRVTVSYMRYNRLGDRPQLMMAFRNLPEGTPVTVSEVSASTRVWDVTSPCAVMELVSRYDETSGSLVAPVPGESGSDGNLMLAVFDPELTLFQPEYVGEVVNQNLHASETPDMIILSSGVCRAEAERLAAAHRSFQGMTVLVVDQETVFNEFSSGTPSFLGLRRLAKMFYDRDPQKFRHLLLFGGATYDNRAIESGIADHFDRFLLTYEVESLSHMGHGAMAYVSDAYFGMLEDDYSHSRILSMPMSINVGRIPAIMGDNAASAVDKIIGYLSSPGSGVNWRKALILADGGDSNTHLVQGEDLCDTITKYSPATSVIKCYNPIYPLDGTDGRLLREAVKRNLTSGVGYLAFMGHGSPVGFSANNMWSRLLAQTVDYDVAPLAMFSTCDTYSFDRNDNGIAEHMIYKATGGAIGVIAAARTVYRDYNQYLNTGVAQEVFSAGASDYTGDVYRRARNRLVGTTRDPDVQINTMSYNFCGDPALPLRFPSLSAVIDSTTDSLSLYPLAVNSLKGYIACDDGSVDTSFSGRVTATLYEPESVTMSIRQGAYADNEPRPIKRREDIVSECVADVVDGRFSLDIKFPLRDDADVPVSLQLTALSDDETRYAMGMNSNVVLRGYDESVSVADEASPAITGMYIDTPEFTDGDITDGSLTLYATVDPGVAGLNTSTLSVAGALRLVVDGKRSVDNIMSYLTMHTDGSVRLEIPVANLDDGHHRLTLSVADNACNRVSRSVVFTVINRPVSASVEIAEYPAVEEATIKLSHTFANTPEGRIIIEDSDGNTVFSTRDTGAGVIRWNLTDASGQRVRDGRYSCYAILRDGMKYASTPRAEIIVIGHD